MAKYHEVGRFIVGDTKDENDIDWESAIFHEEHAAELGELEAMVTMAKLYLGQERDVLVNCVVEVGVTVNCVVEVPYILAYKYVSSISRKYFLGQFLGNLLMSCL